MSDLRNYKVKLVVCSDIHLCHSKPPARDLEADWYSVMDRSMFQLSTIQKEAGGVPILIAGDLFDRWNSPVELVNFASDVLPKDCYAIPGQHDLPNHSYEHIERSAYWNLCQSGVITNLFPYGRKVINDVDVQAFPWGTPLDTSSSKYPGIKLALCHHFVWSAGTGFVGAFDGDRASSISKQIEGFTLGVFGDNHKAFSEGSVFNCGTLMRRHLNEIKYKPRVGLVMDDGSIHSCLLDCSEDKFCDSRFDFDISGEVVDMSLLKDALEGLRGDSLDYQKVVHTAIEDEQVSPGSRAIVSDILDRSAP